MTAMALMVEDASCAGAEATGNVNTIASANANCAARLEMIARTEVIPPRPGLYLVSNVSKIYYSESAGSSIDASQGATAFSVDHPQGAGNCSAAHINFQMFLTMR